MLNDDTESIDYRRYRVSQLKQNKIEQVEKVLQNNAVDCYLNQSVHNRKSVTKKQLNSFNNIQTVVVPSTNQDCTKSYYKKIAFENLNPKIVYLDIINLSNVIKQIIRNNDLTFFTRKSLLQYISHPLVDYTLSYMIKNKVPVHMGDNKHGYLIITYNNNNTYYVFQPAEIDDTKITINERSSKPKNHIKKYMIKTNIKTNTTSMYVDSFSDKINKIEARFTEYFKAERDIITDMVIDSLSKTSLENLFMYISKIKVDFPAIYKSLCDGDYINTLTDDDEIIIYDIYERRFIQNKNTCAYLKCDKLKKQLRDKYKKNFINILGFVDINKKTQKTVVKIKHIDDKIKNDNNISGSACVQTSTFTKELMIKYIKKIKNINITHISKEDLCLLYEYLLRESGLFARPVQTILEKN